MLAVAYPAFWNAFASVNVFGSSSFFHSGTFSLANGRSCPAIQSVMCRRAGYCPVSRAARVGLQTVQAL
jgi:hypothetical protein